MNRGARSAIAACAAMDTKICEPLIGVAFRAVFACRPGDPWRLRKNLDFLVRYVQLVSANQEEMMRFSARVLAVMVLFVLVGTTALADDTAKPKDAAKKSDAGSASTSATATSEAATKPLPAAFALAPRPKPAPASSSSSMRGENTPAAELFGGYSYLRFTTDNRPIVPFPTVNIPDRFDLQGATESITGNFTDWFGLAADFGQYRTWHHPAGAHVDTFTYLFGPQFSFRKNERVTPFFHALFGVARASAYEGSPAHQNSLDRKSVV